MKERSVELSRFLLGQPNVDSDAGTPKTFDAPPGLGIRVASRDDDSRNAGRENRIHTWRGFPLMDAGSSVTYTVPARARSPLTSRATRSA